MSETEKEGRKPVEGIRWRVEETKAKSHQLRPSSDNGMQTPWSVLRPSTLLGTGKTSGRTWQVLVVVS